MRRLLAGGLLAAALAAEARAAVPAPPAPAAEVKTSTAAPMSVATIYPVDRLRDPFRKGSGGSVASKPMAPEDFNIHNLTLRGLMKDSGTDYALFTDNNFGASFVLRRGALYDYKGKPVPGVAGKLNIAQKTAHLITRDNDVQVYRLGDEGKE